MDERGSFLTTKSFNFYSKSYRVNVADTLGAGDTFLAGFLYKIFPVWEKTKSFRNLSKEEAEEASKFSNAMGALACIKIGAIPSFTYLNEVNDFLARY